MAQDNPAFTASTTDIPFSYEKPANGATRNASIGNGATSNGSALQNGTEKPVYTIDNNSKQKDEEADYYDPYDHNETVHPTSNMDTLFHLLKGCLGTGILAMPEAFKFAGYIMGVVGTVIIGFICTLTVHLLVRAEYELARRRRVPTMTYPETAQAALQEGPPKLQWLSKYIGTIVNIFILANQMGACTVYFIFIAKNIKEITDVYMDKYDLHIHIAVILVPIILLNYVRDLKYLAPFSTIATTLTMVSFVIILYYVFRRVPSFDDKVAIGNITDYPLFIGTALFSLEAIGVMMPLKNSMRTPQSFGGTFGVLNRAMVPIVVLFIALGLFGYLEFGDKVQASITLSLPEDEIPAQAVKIMMAFAIFVSHGLMNYVSFEIIWEQNLQPRCEKQKVSGKLQTLYEYLIRTAIVLFHFTLASIFGEKLGPAISLIGALCLSAIGLAFPAFIHLTTFWYSCKTRAQFYRMATRDSAIIIFALFALVIGTYTSIREFLH